jgi:DNA-directed RNA polymerase subunit K/omega
MIIMTAPKIETNGERSCCNPEGASVYEIAIAAAREAKRINERFYEAKKIPPRNVVITALKRVAKGRVAYTIEEEAPEKAQDDSGNGDSPKED